MTEQLYFGGLPFGGEREGLHRSFSVSPELPEEFDMLSPGFQ